MKGVTLTGIAGVLAALGAYGVSNGLISQSALAGLTAKTQAGSTTGSSGGTSLADSSGSTAAPTPIDSNVIPATQLGVNLGTPTYYSWEFAFVDLIKNNGAIWLDKLGQQLSDQLPTTAEGRPYNVPKLTSMTIPLLDGPYVPAGTYTCEISPGWYVGGFFSLQNKLTFSGTTFSFTIPANPTDWPTYKIGIQAMVDNARLDKLSCTRKDLPSDTTFNPVWINDMKNFGVIRFMDWGQANNNPPGTWATRPTTNQFSQASVKGVALEYMVEAANQMDVDPWLNIPYAADDDYVRKFATYVRDHMSAKHKAYFEYSNEMWNGGFYQAQQAVALGKPLYKDVSGDFQAGDYWYCDRHRQIMAIIDDVFASQKQRRVRVLGVQVSWPARTDKMMLHNDTWRSTDLVAGAPYFNSDVSQLPGTGAARVTALFNTAKNDVDQAIFWAQQTKIVANRYGVKFGSYEGGQHYFSYDPTVGADIGAALSDQRMYGIYNYYLTQWQQKVGGLLTLYSGTGGNGFPMLQYTGQPLSAAPRMRAAQDFIKTLPSNK